jgi:twinkle protein
MIHDRHRTWLDARGIDPALAEKFGLETVQREGGFWLSVPYLEKGEALNHKYRQTSTKDHRMDTGAPLLLWNADALSHPDVLNGSPVIITEGEWDALAAMTAGLKHVVSVPNGAPQDTTPEPENAKRYEFVWRHIDAIDKVKQFIIATDGDRAGRILAADLVSLLGAERCRFVQYPEKCKDLNDVALAYGHAAVVEIIHASKPYPIKGLYTMDDFPEKAEVVSFPVGIDPINDMIRIVPGTLTVFTGYANMGKTTVMNGVIANALSHNVPTCVASFETDVKPILRDGLRAAIMKCSASDLRTRDTSAADELIRDNLTIITQAVDEDDEMDIAAFLEYCRISVVRDGTKLIVLDPWNEVEHKRRRDESETEYISRALRMVKKFAKQYDVAFWIVAHPTKPMDGRMRVPGLYEISGSANWANKADYGLTYHRPKPDVNEAELRVTKVRMGLPGKKGSVTVTYDFRSSEFRKVEGFGG